MGLFNRLMFNLWYFRRPPWDSGVTPPELLNFLKGRPAGRAIDLGCGTGTNLITLARLGWQVTGVDFAARAIDRARKKAKQAGVSVDLRVGDVTHLDDLAVPYDFALDLGCFHSLSDKGKGDYLRQMDRILVRGGVWFLYAFLRRPKDFSLPGLSDVDLERISANFGFCSRSDGFERGERPSAYFIFQKQ